MRLPGGYRLRMALRAMRKTLLRFRAQRAVARFPNVTHRAAHGLHAPLVVTLTSYSPRFEHLGRTLRSLLDQTIAVDETILWVAADDYAELPDDVLALCDHGLSIRKTADVKSYKKLIPALTENPDRFFVTADDDVYYPPDWLAGLVEETREHPERVIAYRAHLAPLGSNDVFKPYSQWSLATHRLETEELDARLFPTGVVGILYPPGAFANEVTDESLFMELAPRGDDIWFFWMARNAGFAHRRTRQWFDIVEWPDSQQVVLYNTNLPGDGNDRQLQNMYDHRGPMTIDGNTP